MYLHQSPLLWAFFYAVAAVALVLTGVDITVLLGA
jgi:hypothetical protein